MSGIRRVVCVVVVSALAGIGVAGRPDAALPAPDPENAHGVTLSWHARQEQDVYGYLVYRSERREGPFIRVNREIIHAQGVETDVADYQFMDSDVKPGRTYYYYLDTISAGGLKQRFSGVISKRVADGE